LTGKIPDRQNFYSKYPGMGFPGPWGKKSFFPPNNWCCPVLPLLHSTHKATNYWQRQCAAHDRFSQEVLSSAQPPLIETSWDQMPARIFLKVLALLERCEIVSLWALSTTMTVPLKS
jgi:hypothetical protein